MMTYAKEYRFTKPNEQQIITHDKDKGISINKYVASTGLTSRRGAETYIKDGRIRINDQIATLGDRVNEGDQVFFDLKPIQPLEEKVYILLNKPEGITCSTDPNIADNIALFMNYRLPIFPIGRLDKQTTGLILLTNDGDIVNKLLRKEYGHEKEYLVTLNKTYDDAFIKEMQAGVTIYNLAKNEYVVTDPAVLYPVSEDTFKIILKQGLNRQIRRMCQTLGYEVTSLKRIRFMHLHLNDLPLGQYRYLTSNELIELQEQIKNQT